MRHVLRGWLRSAHDDAGAAMAEYALVATGIAVVVGVAAAGLGGRLVTMFGTFF